jgi:hypothetical protein
MAKYLLLIYGDEQQWEAETEADSQQKGEAHVAFSAAVAAAGGAKIDGGALEYTASATTLRAGVDGRPTVTDGPFLETKEAVGGYYLIEATDLDQAIALAALLPEVAVSHSGVEIRPVMGSS